MNTLHIYQLLGRSLFQSDTNHQQDASCGHVVTITQHVR